MYNFDPPVFYKVSKNLSKFSKDMHKSQLMYSEEEITKVKDNMYSHPESEKHIFIRIQRCPNNLNFCTINSGQ